MDHFNTVSEILLCMWHKARCKWDKKMAKICPDGAIASTHMFFNFLKHFLPNPI